MTSIAAVARLPGVTLLDLDDLRDWAASGVAERAVEAAKVGHIVAEEVGRYGEESVARQAAPLVAQLHERAEAVRRSELARFEAKLAGLDERERAAVETLTQAIVAKLLHEPTASLKREPAPRVASATPPPSATCSTWRDPYPAPGHAWQRAGAVAGRSRRCSAAGRRSRPRRRARHRRDHG